MNHARLRRERRELARNAIVEPDTECNQQIAFGYGHVRRVGPVHSQHPQAEWMRRRKTTKTHQCRRDREPQRFSEQAQRFVSAGVCDASADIKNWPLRIENRVDCTFALLLDRQASVQQRRESLHGPNVSGLLAPR